VKPAQKSASSKPALSSSYRKLPRSFYLRPALRVAKDLLGTYFIRRVGDTRLVGKIVEVEAYDESDPASHSYRGRTRRNDVMFWKGGHLYVYFTYGMHFCANVVTGPEGRGEAVLIRAIEPVEGLEIMRRNRSGRKNSPHITEKNLTNGPAKFCEAFGIGREENGSDLLEDYISITRGERIPPSKILQSTRIGIRNGREKRWRFYVKGNKWVSR
jgi:DNA-3-methyladenine glycosylase